MNWTGKCKYDDGKLNFVPGLSPFPSFRCASCGKQYQMKEEDI